MKMNVKIKDLQIARDIIRKELKSLATRKNATIGIHEDAGMHEGGITNAQLGATLNYGTDKIPPRPWLVPGAESGRKEQIEAFAETFVKTGGNSEAALEAAAATAVGNVQQYMTDLKDPPNAPSTIAKKGSSNPLINTGSLRSSVTYKINNVKPEEGL